MAQRARPYTDEVGSGSMTHGQRVPLRPDVMMKVIV
jgi:hypothetical protein